MIKRNKKWKSLKVALIPSLFFLFALLGVLFELWSTQFYGPFQINYIVFGLLLLVSAMVWWWNRKSVNALIIVILFFWFFYLTGLYLRPVFFTQNVSEANGSAIIAAFLCALIGAALIPQQQAIAETMELKKAPRRLGIVLRLGLLVSLVAAVVWWALKGGIPILMSDINIARTTNNYFVVRQFIFTAPVPFWIALCYPSYARRNRVFLTLYFLIVAFLLLSTGFRSFPLGFCLISLIILYRRNPLRKISLKMALGIVLAGIVVLYFGVYRNKQTISDFDNRDSLAMAAQVFFNLPSALEEITKLFPAFEPFAGPALYFRSFGFILPGEQKGVGNWLKEDILEADFIGGGYNPGLLGELFIVGGYPLLFAGIFLWAIAIAVFLNRASSSDPYRSCSGAMLSLYAALSILPGISTIVAMVTYFYLVLLGTKFALSGTTFIGKFGSKRNPRKRDSFTIAGHL